MTTFVEVDLGFPRMLFLLARVMEFLLGVIAGSLNGLFRGINNRQ
jgi:hypothetical protein